MLEQRARLFRQCIVNQNAHIASSALCAGINLFNEGNAEVIRRWVNEVRETTKSNNGNMISFHGLHLLYKIHSKDRKAVQRLVTTMISNPSDSPFTRCLLIRYAFSTLNITDSDLPPKNILNFITSSIKQYKKPMVVFEAAKALCHMPNVTENQLTIAINALQEFLNSSRYCCILRK